MERGLAFFVFTCAAVLAVVARAGVAGAGQPEGQPEGQGVPATAGQVTPPASEAIGPVTGAPEGSHASTMLDSLVGGLDGPVDRGWTVRVEPAFWYAAPRGSVTLPTSVGPVEFEGATFAPDAEADLFELDADDPTAAVLGRIHFARDRWRFTIGATHLGTSGEDEAEEAGRLGDAFFAMGDLIDTDFQMTTFDASASYIVLHGPKGDDPGDPDRFGYTLEVLAGARFEHLDVDVQVTPGSGARPPELGLVDHASELFGQPIAGTRLTMDLFKDFTIEVGVTLGYWSFSGGSTASTWDILAAFTWRPIENVGIQVGYQYLGLSASRDVDDGEFEFSGSSAGLFGGLAFQF